MSEPNTSISCRLLHHGAAAESSSKAVICIPASDSTEAGTSSSSSSEIVYASHAVLNVAHRVSAHVADKQEPVWRVCQTLRTNSQGSANANMTVSTYTAKRVISCISLLRNAGAKTPATVVCGFSDGTISTWQRNVDNQWAETILVRADDSEYWDGRAITDIGGIHENDEGSDCCIVTCSSGGAFQYRGSMVATSEGNVTLKRTQLIPTPANAVRFHKLDSNEEATLLLIGTASPRHNKIHVFVVYDDSKENSKIHQPSTHYCGSLSGHEDWITCFDWRSLGSVNHLASGSQDARIRLWKFTTTTSTSSRLVQDGSMPELEANAGDIEGDEEEDDDDEEEIEEGESRLEIIVPGKSQTSVTLEALLIGHEERVTAVAWHPNPQPIYGEDLILISSSMDRSIFIWGELSGIWTPISRVGSAGGILGGSIGSSLLGFLNVQLEPKDGRWMMGHGYGGALHFFSCEPASTSSTESIQSPEMNVEDRASLSPWKAQPCLTGHFDNVTDLCWESAAGDYLLTVGMDHTCRVWAPLPVSNASIDDSPEHRDVWVEIARPQVHGYVLSAITSLSTPDHKHLLVSGADEKELRVFDATRTFDHLLHRASPRVQPAAVDSNQRVDLAFIPSLGLSNKATASEGAEQDTGGVSESITQLPLERDLGALSLWPETLKLYGHNTELTRLTSTTTAMSGTGISEEVVQKDVLVASSAKARDVDAACIRLWNVSENRCAQVLKGGHKSTVTAMSFSPDTRFLVSSGKDRRLCVWERKSSSLSEGSITWGAFELSCAVDVAHKRIVWGAHFCPFDSTVFATCSRDGSIKIWKLSEAAENNQKTSLEEIHLFSPKSMANNGKPEAVTSVAFAPTALQNTDVATAVLAVGLETGVIELWLVQLNGPCDSPAVAMVFPPEHCHIAAVTKLAWRPNRLGEDKMVLASCSMDHGCRIFEVTN
jgi:elongator complex protein 2